MPRCVTKAELRVVIGWHHMTYFLFNLDSFWELNLFWRPGLAQEGADLVEGYERVLEKCLERIRSNWIVLCLELCDSGICEDDCCARLNLEMGRANSA